MTLSTIPVFEQEPKAISIPVSAANTNLDGTGTIVTLLTAGSDGSVVKGLRAWAVATSTGARLNLWLSIDAGVTWKLLDAELMSAYTKANTTVQTPVVFVDRTDPDDEILLPANAVLGVTTMVAEAVVFQAEWRDF